ncbi:molybdenum cofactor guanylyltransferase MobA [Spiribacter insolitus]|uniref:Molybdenum cofactor guanylyltransferase n=1 Tax=Spiribacter insolitus TaxID=3122417 RepID=A0ABV3T8A4_9GAMM
MAEPTVSAVILAGGRGRRMGYQDKGLVECNGQPLVAHVMAAIAPCVGDIAINANRNLDEYGRLSRPVIKDRHPDYPGPLAGIAAGLDWCPTEALFVVPCDTPGIHGCCVERLRAALDGAEIAVAHDGHRLQPLHALVRRRCRDSLTRFLAAGGRRVDQWIETLDWRQADCSDRPEMFFNINSPEALHD